VPVNASPGPDQIRDSNTFSLAAYAELAGAEIERLALVGDDLELLKSEIREAAVSSDVVVLSGGVSMGVYDFTKTALRELQAEIFFERVSLRPGKPTVFAKLSDALVFGLPGNPVSVSVTFNLFARTAIRAMQGARDVLMREAQAELTREVRGAGERESFLPAELRTDASGRLLAEPLKWGGSSDFVAFARADALINVPQGLKTIEAGRIVRVLHLPL
jgi:molybdopterin molybdotransferase